MANKVIPFPRLKAEKIPRPTVLKAPQFKEPNPAKPVGMKGMAAKLGLY